MFDDPSDDRYVHLAGGFVLPVEVVLLALRLERDGFRFAIDETGHLLASPIDRLSPADRAELRRLHDFMVTLVRYEADDRHLYDDPTQATRKPAHAS